MKIRIFFAVMVSLCLLTACENQSGKETDAEEVITIVDSTVDGGAQTVEERKETVGEGESGKESEETESSESMEVIKPTEESSAESTEEASEESGEFIEMPLIPFD